MMNWIWLGLVMIAIVCAGFTGQMQELTIRSFESAQEAVWLALKLVGIMAFWLGIMRVAQESGLMRVIARGLRRPMHWLFPEIPENHPAMSAMIMNFGANMLGLANAATPFGIKAMVELNKLNKEQGTATNAMCLFLAINTSSLSLLATGTIGLRAAAGSTDPAGIWLPSLLASAVATTVGILAAKGLQRLRRYKLPEQLVAEAGQAQADSADEAAVADATADTQEATDDTQEGGAESAEVIESDPSTVGRGVKIFVWVCILSLAAAAVFHYFHAVQSMLESKETAEKIGPAMGICLPMAQPWMEVSSIGWTLFKDFFSFWSIPLLMATLLLAGLRRGVRVYESLVEGAKEGFRVAVRIIPYLVAIIVAVAMFKASGAMDILGQTLGRLTGLLGMPAEVLPMAVIRPLSGNGAFGYMSSIFTQYGPDSFAGYMVSVMQGSTETTLYVLAVYFGAVQVHKVRHALPAGLTADMAGVIAAVALTHVFF